MRRETNNDKVRAIAFYLPQYHPIPENDAWWGDGFTEWTNVRKATPLFFGHYQPHVPDEFLGYYDLRDGKAQEKQAELARTYGIYGFCYYHYWFGGKKLLETPLQNILKSKKPDFPFCVCWANENWSRRWDGREKEILISQNHSDEDDTAFIHDLEEALKDSRYITVDGKPLLIIYRTELFPDIKRSSEIWRREAVNMGLKGLYLVRVESFKSEVDPSLIGFDAAIEFAPDWKNIVSVDRQNNKKASMHGYSLEKNQLLKKEPPHMYDYVATMQRMLEKKNPSYKLFRGAFPSWDNAARRGQNGTIFLGSSPSQFKYFLFRQYLNTRKMFKGDERLLFINAWNEWGEGCHLEPDKKWGMSYLEACGDVLKHNIKLSNDDLIDQIEDLEREIRELRTSLEKSQKYNKKIMQIEHKLKWAILHPIEFAKKYMKILLSWLIKK